MRIAVHADPLEWHRFIKRFIVAHLRVVRFCPMEIDFTTVNRMGGPTGLEPEAQQHLNAKQPSFRV